MRLYSFIVTLGGTIIITLNAVFGSQAFGYDVLYCVLAVVFGAFAVVSIDVIVALAVKAMPEKWFSRDSKFFVMSKKERKLFEKLGIRRWKTHVPDMGVLGGAVRKSRMMSLTDNDYIARFLLESAYGQVIHILAAVMGYGLVPLYPLEYWYCFGLPIAVINCVLNCMSLFVLRYNFGRLKALYMFNERKRARLCQMESDKSVGQNHI